MYNESEKCTKDVDFYVSEVKMSYKYGYINIYLYPVVVSRLSPHRYTVHRSFDTPFVDVAINGVYILSLLAFIFL